MKNNSQSPKVVIIGAGSLFFGRSAIWQMIHSPHLQNGTLALVDTDAARLEKMTKLAQMAIDHNKVSLKLESSTDRREVLPGADFVVLSFANRNVHFRGIDTEVSAKYNIRMCSSDTIGPGGVFRTLRELPEIFDCCRDIEELCPDAWLINYINPTAVNGIGIKRFFPQLKSFAICDAQYHLRKQFAELANVTNDENLVVQSVGPNHFTWLLKAEYKGKDIVPQIIEAMKKKENDINEQAQGGKTDAKGWLNNSIGLELYEAFGHLATVVSHTKEYVRFYQGRSTTGLDKHPALKLFETDNRITWTNNVWKRVDDYVSGAVDIAEFNKEFGPDPATDIIENMWGNLGKRYFINTHNQGACPNMADDDFIELYCDLDMNGPRPLPTLPLPRGIKGLCETVLDTHELTAEAVWKKDKTLVRRALLTDPLTNSIGDTDALMEELFKLQRDGLPDYWYE